MQLGAEVQENAIVTEARDLKRELMITGTLGVVALSVGLYMLIDVLIEYSMYSSGMFWTHLAIGGSLFALGFLVLYFLSGKLNEKINALQKNFFAV